MSHPVKATTDTLYDLASNTKMYATNFALQKLMSEGKLQPDDLISKYIPDFGDRPGMRLKGKARYALRICCIIPAVSLLTRNTRTRPSRASCIRRIKPPRWR